MRMRVRSDGLRNSTGDPMREMDGRREQRGGGSREERRRDGGTHVRHVSTGTLWNDGIKPSNRQLPHTFFCVCGKNRYNISTFQDCY